MDKDIDIQRGIAIVKATRRLHDACESYHYDVITQDEFIIYIKRTLHILTKDTPVPESLLFQGPQRT